MMHSNICQLKNNSKTKRRQKAGFKDEDLAVYLQICIQRLYQCTVSNAATYLDLNDLADDIVNTWLICLRQEGVNTYST